MVLILSDLVSANRKQKGGDYMSFCYDFATDPLIMSGPLGLM
jgi:hypothetical protein